VRRVAIVLAAALTACSAPGDDLAACRLEALKALATADLSHQVAYAQLEMKGALVSACMEAKGYRIDKPRYHNIVQSENRWMQEVLINEPTVWDRTGGWLESLRNLRK
jgi:hypothetical protein